jgi:diguanylate cyclase (GGDEF)-like protein
MSNYLKKSIEKFANDVLAKIIYDITKWALLLIVLFILGQLLPENTSVGSFLKRNLSISVLGLILIILFSLLICFLLSSFAFSKKIKKIQADNHTDELTGLLNHKALKEKLIQITQEAKKTNRSLAIILMDIDDFKNFNSQYGYKKADEILIKLGQLLRSDSRITDLTFRQHLKGDEFIVLAMDTDINGAIRAADRKRTIISSTIFTVSGDHKTFHITVCCGITVFNPLNDTVDELLNRATKAMLAAKTTKDKNSTQSVI